MVTDVTDVSDVPFIPEALAELRQVQVYQTRPDGVFVGYAVADESPLEPGNYLIPGGCVTEEPPTFGDGNRARWDWGAEEWIIEPNPEAPQEPEPKPDPVKGMEVSIRQFTQALAETGRLSWDEARAWSARGVIPEQIQTQVDNIEDDLERNRTLMFLEAAKTVEQEHPKTQALAILMEWTPEELGALMAYAATL